MFKSKYFLQFFLTAIGKKLGNMAKIGKIQSYFSFFWDFALYFNDNSSIEEYMGNICSFFKFANWSYGDILINAGCLLRSVFFFREGSYYGWKGEVV